jgi:hypothetical protein
MSAHLPIRELVRGGCLPTGQREGLLVILRAYFDDAGTHASSDVTVMGGLIGTVEQWTRFETSWAERLADPLPGYGKSPLRMFHLNHCVRHWPKSEFERYSDTESAALRHDFRQIIIDAKLTGVAAAVDKKAWDQLVVGRVRNLLGDSISVCFQKCIEEIVRFSEPKRHGFDLAFWFDQGIQTPFLEQISGLWTRPEFGSLVKSVNFSKVECVLPLQGADIVATENYWMAAEALKLGGQVRLAPHLRHYLDNMLHQTTILDRSGIEIEVSRRGPDGRVLPGREFF